MKRKGKCSFGKLNSGSEWRIWDSFNWDNARGKSNPGKFEYHRTLCFLRLLFLQKPTISLVSPSFPSDSEESHFAKKFISHFVFFSPEPTPQSVPEGRTLSLRETMERPFNCYTPCSLPNKASSFLVSLYLFIQYVPNGILTASQAKWVRAGVWLNWFRPTHPPVTCISFHFNFTFPLSLQPRERGGERTGTAVWWIFGRIRGKLRWMDKWDPKCLLLLLFGWPNP